MSESDPLNAERPAGLAADVTKRYVTMVLAALSLLVMTTIAFVVPLPYSTIQPGPVHDTLGAFDGREMIQFGDDVEVYDTDGTLFLTTALVSSVDADIRLPYAVMMYLRPNASVIPSRVLNPQEETAEESRERGQVDMERSKANAEVAGLRAAGFEVGEDVVVAGTIQDGPSDGILESGDLVRAVNGTPVETVEAFIAQISQSDIGDEVALTVDRDGEETELSVTTTEDEQNPGRPIVGIQVGVEFDMPIEVDNNVGHSIGGASAGSIFALAIYDRLTPGSLTGGLRVAGTGEIDSAGQIGPIGGVQQKLAGASSARAQVFLVPQANCAAASAAPDFGMVVVGVEDLDAAISALETLGEPGDAEDVSPEALLERAEDASLSLCR